MSETRTAWQEWFESVWEMREEVVYRGFFGEVEPRIFNLSEGLFRRLGQQEIDPRWLTHGILACPPHGDRKHWAYVTTGMSNPWGEDPTAIDANGPSGLGFELLMYAPERAPWAISTLQWLMAVQILVAVGKLEGELVNYFDRVPLGGPIDPQRPGTPLRHLLTAEPVGIPPGFVLPSGKVALVLCVGITDRERDFARAQGGPELVGVLEKKGYFPATDPARASAV